MESINQNNTTDSTSTLDYVFPQTPFESIGFALSGGGFRAATYGLGVLSLLNEIKWVEDQQETTLLQKVQFVSSASGGTITLSVYVAALHQNIPFKDYYNHLNQAITGEVLVKKAISILQDDVIWKQTEKSRNIINAFSIAYHENLFTIIPETARTLGGIMSSNPDVHIKEFCFNSTDFYTGISFRFQGADDWSGNSGGMFGNSNIGIEWKNKNESISSLKLIRLADVLAASSCFPMGFEPIMYPKDFTYSDGPSSQNLKDAIALDTISWDDKATLEENLKSPRAEKEKAFSETKTFGLMDGGIWDNQGLYSLLLANERGNEQNVEPEKYHRFDLMMVSDVTSFFMSPYNVPEIKTNKKWMEKSLTDYWQKIKGIYNSVSNWIARALWIGILVVILFALPLILEGITAASIILSIVGILLLILTIILNRKYKKFLNTNHVIRDSLNQPTLQDLIRLHMKEESFARRTLISVTNYLQGVQTGILLQIINARLQSSAIMIGEVFLKHIRRLIYDHLFSFDILHLMN